MSDKEVVQEIKNELMQKLNSRFGYCGVAESEDFIMLNSGSGNIVIEMKWEKE